MSRHASVLAPVSVACAAITVGVSIASVVGLAGHVTWFADLFSHFRPQYVALLAPALVFHAWRRQYAFAALAGVCLLSNAALIAPLYAAPVGVAHADDEGLSIVQFNVLRSNARLDEGIAFLRASDADLILLQEFDARWAAAMAADLGEYAVVLAEPRSTHFGAGLYLRRAAGFDVRSAELIRVDDEGWRHPAIEAHFEGGGRRFGVLGVHAHPPLNRRVAWIQSVELERVADWSRAYADEHVVLGDLNATPWSWLYGRLLRDSRLRSARDGFGIVSTWHPFAGLMGGLPVDHVLHTDGFEAVSFAAGPDLGSDHRPIVARLRWRRDTDVARAASTGAEPLPRR